MQIEFTHAVQGQMKDMFLQYYPSYCDLAEEFSVRLIEVLHGEQISMASLQDFFMTMHSTPAEETLLQLQSFFHVAPENTEWCES